MEGLRRRGPATWFPLLLFLLLRSFDFCSSLSDEGRVSCAESFSRTKPFVSLNGLIDSVGPSPPR